MSEYKLKISAGDIKKKYVVQQPNVGKGEAMICEVYTEEELCNLRTHHYFSFESSAKKYAKLNVWKLCPVSMDEFIKEWDKSKNAKKQEELLMDIEKIKCEQSKLQKQLEKKCQLRDGE